MWLEFFIILHGVTSNYALVRDCDDNSIIIGQSVFTENSITLSNIRSCNFFCRLGKSQTCSWNESKKICTLAPDGLIAIGARYPRDTVTVKGLIVSTKVKCRQLCHRSVYCQHWNYRQTLWHTTIGHCELLLDVSHTRRCLNGHRCTCSSIPKTAAVKLSCDV